MDGVAMKIEGLKELEEKLSQMSQDGARRAIRKGLRAGANIVQAAIRERAPERPDLPSGTALPPGALAADIEIHSNRDEDGNLGALVGPGKYTAHVANWVENGHRLVVGWRSTKGKDGKYRGPGKAVKQVAAYPFVRPAYEASAEEAAKVICDTIAQEVTKQGSKQEEVA